MPATYLATRTICPACKHHELSGTVLCDFCTGLYVQYENGYLRRKHEALKMFEQETGVGVSRGELYGRLPRMRGTMPEDKLPFWPGFALKVGVVLSGLFTLYIFSVVVKFIAAVAR